MKYSFRWYFYHILRIRQLSFRGWLGQVYVWLLFYHNVLWVFFFYHSYCWTWCYMPVNPSIGEGGGLSVWLLHSMTLSQKKNENKPNEKQAQQLWSSSYLITSNLKNISTASLINTFPPLKWFLRNVLTLLILISITLCDVKHLENPIIH